MIEDNKDLREAEGHLKASQDMVDNVAALAWLLGFFCFLSFVFLFFAFEELGIVLIFGVMLTITLYIRAKYISRVVQQHRELTILKERIQCQEQQRIKILNQQRDEENRLKQEVVESERQQQTERIRLLRKLEEERIVREETLRQEEILINARLIKVGSVVTIKNTLTQQTTVYSLGPAWGMRGKYDPLPISHAGRISSDSPLGSALLNQTTGQKIIVCDIPYLILEVSNNFVQHVANVISKGTEHVRQQHKQQKSSSVSGVGKAEQSASNLDGSKYLGYMAREGGAFGSYLEYDDMDEESFP